MPSSFDGSPAQDTTQGDDDKPGEDSHKDSEPNQEEDPLQERVKAALASFVQESTESTDSEERNAQDSQSVPIGSRQGLLMEFPGIGGSGKR